MWALATFARPVMARLLGVPRGLPLTAADTRTVTDLIGSIFPVVPRAEGVTYDFFVSNPDVNNCHLAAVTVPTAIVYARDDPLISYDTARRAAELAFAAGVQADPVEEPAPGTGLEAGHSRR
jgi:pimeloyl-ACP methyl ester carboxylesterase